MKKEPKTVSPTVRGELLDLLKARFEKHGNRHPGLSWDKVLARLEANPGQLGSLYEMERTGGEPDVVEWDKSTGEVVFADCAPESPIGRRSLCYDQEALDARKKDKPVHSAVGMAVDMGISLLTETQYRRLQELGTFDAKTSSWILTPSGIRSLGGALFCDCRYDTVFVYHNGAESYYSSRGFRGSLRV